MTDKFIYYCMAIDLMDNEKLIEILSDWNFWRKDADTGILREDYVNRVESLTKTGQVVAITGPRRCGKSTLMKQFIKKQIERGVDRNSFLYANFEEPKLADALSPELLQQMYDAYLQIVKPNGTPYILLDEVPHIKKWERFARGLHEKKAACVLVSGSTSKLLS